MSKDEKISIMVNEEDHFRSQVILSGFDLKKCWQILDQVDKDLEKIFLFLFCKEYDFFFRDPVKLFLLILKDLFAQFLFYFLLTFI